MKTWDLVGKIFFANVVGFVLLATLVSCSPKHTAYVIIATPRSNEEASPSLGGVSASQRSSLVDASTESGVSSLEDNGLLAFRGIDFYPSPNPYSSEEAVRALEALLELKEVNWVQLRFFVYQTSLDASSLELDEDQYNAIRAMIHRIHYSGRKVALMPHVVVDADRYWGALIRPSDEKKWFASYRRLILRYALLAQAEHVELFSVANEMISLWRRNDEWAELVSEVRLVYGGDVTAKMNSWWQEEYFRKVLGMDWLSKLDYIGIAPYFDLTEKKDPSIEELRAAWKDNRHGLDVFTELEELSQTFDKKIIFLEIGFRSLDGTNIEPWNRGPVVPDGSSLAPTVDQKEQAMCVQALFDVFAGEPWFEGAFWYYWPTSTVLDPSDTSWSVAGKLAERVIRENFARKKG